MLAGAARPASGVPRSGVPRLAEMVARYHSVIRRLVRRVIRRRIREVTHSRVPRAGAFEPGSDLRSSAVSRCMEVKLEGPAVVRVFDVSDFTEAIIDEVPSPADPHDRQNAWAGGIVFLLSCQLKPA